MPWTSRKTNVDIGKITEQLAAKYLTEQGLIFKACNFHNRRGELDLIMTEANTWVFVAAVSVDKQQKIRQCAAYYLQKSGLNEYNTPCRFDVVTLEGNITNPEITWLKNAF